MSIDPTRQVRLLNIAVKNGNIYHPRIYNPGELPDEIMARVDILDQSFLAPVAPETAVITPTIKNSDVVVEERARFEVEQQLVSPAPYPVQTAVIDKAEQVDVNRATVDQLSRLPHIGTAIATKMDRERDKQPFHSIDDLNTRIPLRGHDWSEIEKHILIQ